MNKNNVDTNKQITHLSLCSGYEGIGIGLRAIFPTLREVAMVEREGFACANLAQKMQNGSIHEAPIFTDVKTFPYRRFLGKVDIISGGFPCQPFSHAGRREGVDDPRHIFPYIRDGIRDCQPRIVFLENVEGIISAKTGEGESVLKYVLRELEGLGYRATAGIFSAEEVSATHRRKRVYILGIRNELGNTTSNGREQRQFSKNTIAASESQIERGNGKAGQTERRLQESKGRCDELAHRERSRMRGRRSGQKRRDDIKGIQSDEAERNKLWGEVEGCSNTSRRKGVADDTSEGLESDSRNELGKAESQRQAKGNERRTSFGGLSRRVWPARPSQRQHEWEEPRVTNVGNAKGKPSSSKNNGRKPSASSDQGQIESRGGNSGSLRKSDGQVESRLGGTNDGIASRLDANRTDRLRLLGNGVVPQTATKAFLTLINRIL